MAKEFVLEERVLTDNVLILAEDGKVFKGGYIGLIREFVFSSAWVDRELPIKRFRLLKRLEEYIQKRYPEFDLNCVQ